MVVGVGRGLKTVQNRTRTIHRFTEECREVAAELVKKDRQRHLDLAEQRSEQLDGWERMKSGGI